MKHGKLNSSALLIRIASVAAIIMTGWLSYIRGKTNQLQIFGEPFFYLDYSAGFIKRGLIGSIFGVARKSLDKEAISSLILNTHWTISALVFLIFLFLLFSTFAKEKMTAFVVMMLLACSQFMPTQAYNTAYLDIFVFLAYGAAVFAFIQKRFIITSIVCLTGLLIHENFIFLWLPISILAVNAPFERNRFLSLASPFFFLLLILYFHDKEAPSLVLANTPLSKEFTDVIANVSLGQSMNRAFSGMIDIWNQHWLHALKVMPLFLFPTLLIITTYTITRKIDWRNLVFIFIASFSPLSILAFAWDLSRFLVFTNLSAVASIVLYEHIFSPEKQHEWNKELACLNLGIGSILISMPFIYSYFGSNSVIALHLDFFKKVM